MCLLLGIALQLPYLFECFHDDTGSTFFESIAMVLLQTFNQLGRSFRSLSFPFPLLLTFHFDYDSSMLEDTKDSYINSGYTFYLKCFELCFFVYMLMIVFFKRKIFWVTDYVWTAITVKKICFMADARLFCLGYYNICGDLNCHKICVDF